ncbi:hypothetical protein REH65_32905 [Saccharopolyspora sp. ID03-671]|uniref:hypothetical protein n=1 Tax=Saccharopolyspora sp. ID03-671 TaxID=3073066 RepID=UPI0032562968
MSSSGCWRTGPVSVGRRSRGCGWSTGGISGLDQPGLQRFKRKYSTHESRVAALRSRGEASPAEIEVGSTLNAITLLLTEDSVPEEVTARAGAVLYHYFC